MRVEETAAETRRCLPCPSQLREEEGNGPSAPSAQGGMAQLPAPALSSQIDLGQAKKKQERQLGGRTWENQYKHSLLVFYEGKKGGFHE